MRPALLNIDIYSEDLCNHQFSAGTEGSIIASINSLAIALTTSTYLSSPQQDILTQQQAYGIHYKTNVAYMIGAIASMVACALLVLPTYWKFRELGRPVSLARVENANAFRAPVLDHSKASNAVVEDLLKEVGDRRVMFGQMPEGRLAVEEIGKEKSVGTA
jgi:hypothetical protein